MKFFEWDEDQRADVEAAPPCSSDVLFHRDSGVVRGARVLEEESGRTLYATTRYCLFWLENDAAGHVQRVTCIDAREAEPLFWSHYYSYPDDLVQRAHACFRPGESVSVAFQTFTQRRLPPPTFKVIATRHGRDKREYTLRHFPPLRAALLHLDVSADERIETMRLLIGQEAQRHTTQDGR